MSSFRQRFLVCSLILLTLSGGLLALQEVARSGGSAITVADGRSLGVTAVSPGASPNLVPWLPAVDDVVRRVLSLSLLTATVVTLGYMFFMVRRLCREIVLLGGHVRQLRSDDRRTDPSGFSFQESHACAVELSSIAHWLSTERGRLTDDASRDPLTGLPNRRVLMETLTREASAAARTGWSLSVIMVDLDHFKRFNDTYGHQAGDFVLKRAGERMASLVRQMDMVARFGGEEFAVVLPRASLEQAMQIAWQLCNALRCDPMIFEDQTLKVTASFGVAELQVCGDTDADSLVKSADTALYQAKDEGRNTVVAAPKAEDRERLEPVVADADGAEDVPSPVAVASPAIDADTIALMGSTYSMLQVIPETQRVANDMLQQVAATLNCDRVAFYATKKPDNALTPVASVGVPAYEIESYPSVTSELAEWFEFQRNSAGTAPARSVELITVTISSGETSTLCLRIPLVADELLLGLVEVPDLPIDFEITPRQRSLLTAVCLIGVRALQISESFMSQKEAWTGLVSTLCGVVHAERPYKRDHAAQVSCLAGEIAGQLGISEGDELRQIRVAAMIADIGEIKVPKRVREKKGKLRTSEWSLVQRHAEDGAQMIAEIASMDRLAKIVRHHHEHYDGAGYPDGLAGEQIPLESRIIAVADAFVAMTSDRPFRSRVPAVEAERRILVSSGSQFDPAVVNAFLQHRMADASDTARGGESASPVTGAPCDAAGAIA